MYEVVVVYQRRSVEHGVYYVYIRMIAGRYWTRFLGPFPAVCSVLTSQMYIEIVMGQIKWRSYFMVSLASSKVSNANKLPQTNTIVECHSSLRCDFPRYHLLGRN
jgi:hypothetical protein